MADSFPESVRVLEALGYAVFGTCPDGSLRPLHPLPDWAIGIFGIQGQRLSTPSSMGRFPVLENFLVDAAVVWRSKTPHPIVRSGIWQCEDDERMAHELEATALKIDERPLLIIQNVALRGDDHRVLLQAGREQLLELGREIQDFQRLQEQLQRARQTAEQLNRAKSEFLANMSHEIRTPLTGVLGLAALLNDTPQTLEQQRYTRSILDSARGLLRIVNDILDFSRIESGKLEFEKHEFSIRDFMVESVERFRTMAADAGLSLVINFADELPATMIGDPLRLRQIVDNLIANALKFTHEGGITVLVQPATTATECPALAISVTDTGIGIPAHKQNVIFQSFSQADSSTTRKYGGTGLGLSIVQRLLERMGGQITLTSRPGEGSTFRVVIPLESIGATEGLGREDLDRRDSDRDDLELTATRPGPPRQVEIPSGATLPAPTTLQVLLAEDHEINRMLVTQMLVRRGFHVRGVADGQEVLDALQTDDFDVVLMDCQMPQMDGFAATRAIRLQESASGEYIPIIAITAHAMAGFREKCLAEGMDDYICKPFQPEELARTIQTIAHKRRRIGAAKDTDREL